MISNYSVGLYTVMDILERNKAHLVKERADLFCTLTEAKFYLLRTFVRVSI